MKRIFSTAAIIALGGCAAPITDAATEELSSSSYGKYDEHVCAHGAPEKPEDYDKNPIYGHSRLRHDPDEVDGLPLIETDIDKPFVGPALPSTIMQARETTWKLAEHQEVLYQGLSSQAASDWWRGHLDMDLDGDGLTRREEDALGTSDFNPDHDGDGWYDGPMNERWRLVLTEIKALGVQEDSWEDHRGTDETYIVIDDVRFPHSSPNLDNWFNFRHNQTRQFDLVVAERVRGIANHGLAAIPVSLREDDTEADNNWSSDDRIGHTEYIVLGENEGEVILRFGREGDDARYRANFRVERELFADPNPLDADGDSDRDGISERIEAQIATDLGGYTDPEAPTILVEVDHMEGHALNSRADIMVTTAFYRRGFRLHIFRDEMFRFDSGRPLTDNCVTEGELRYLAQNYFDNQHYEAFHYAVMAPTLWVDASGVRVGHRNVFSVANRTIWIDGDAQSQAGTFMHELGHDLGLINDINARIDNADHVAMALIEPFWPYASSMNYLRQPWLFQFGTIGDDYDDWEIVRENLGFGLNNNFINGAGDDIGVCPHNGDDEDFYVDRAPAPSGGGGRDHRQHQY